MSKSVKRILRLHPALNYEKSITSKIIVVSGFPGLVYLSGPLNQNPTCFDPESLYNARVASGRGLNGNSPVREDLREQS